MASLEKQTLLAGDDIRSLFAVLHKKALAAKKGAGQWEQAGAPAGSGPAASPEASQPARDPPGSSGSDGGHAAHRARPCCHSALPLAARTVRARMRSELARWSKGRSYGATSHWWGGE